MGRCPQGWSATTVTIASVSIPIICILGITLQICKIELGEGATHLEIRPIALMGTRTLGITYTLVRKVNESVRIANVGKCEKLIGDRDA